MRDHVPVCETFTSLQGEVQGIGELCFFLRTFGCNLGKECPVDCDTPHSWREEDEGASTSTSVAELVAMVKASGAGAVVITGGEPLLHQDVISTFVARVLGGGVANRVYIETNGTVRPGRDLVGNDRVFFNVSPKTGKPRHEWFPAERTIFKVVVDPAAVDMDKLAKEHALLDPPVLKKYFFMPASKNRESYLAAAPVVARWCIDHGFNFGPRLHLLLWDGKKGT